MYKRIKCQLIKRTYNLRVDKFYVIYSSRIKLLLIKMYEVIYILKKLTWVMCFEKQKYSIGFLNQYIMSLTYENLYLHISMRTGKDSD